MSAETLRLAEMLEDDCITSGIGRREHLDYRIDAAAELRRLHAVEQERDRLREALHDAERSLHGAWQMLDAIASNDYSKDRERAAHRAAEAWKRVGAALEQKA